MAPRNKYCRRARLRAETRGQFMCECTFAEHSGGSNTHFANATPLVSDTLDRLAKVSKSTRLGDARSVAAQHRQFRNLEERQRHRRNCEQHLLAHGHKIGRSPTAPPS